MAALMQEMDHIECDRQSIDAQARTLIEAVRRQRSQTSGVDHLMREFSLSSQEGIALMCLAEALLRVPDAETADALIHDKLAGIDWSEHLGGSGSTFVNAATFSLMLTGQVLRSGAVEGIAAAAAVRNSGWM